MPGDKLRLKELSSKYNAGQIPLREALSRLAASGFVIAQDQRGFRVVSISPEEIADITRVKALMECEALTDSIKNGDVSWESRIVETHYRLEHLPMLEEEGGELNVEWEKAHVDFHKALLAGCSSPLLLDYCSKLRDQTSRYRSLALKLNDNTKRDIALEHQQLMQAAINRNSGEACKLLTEHFEKTTKDLLANLKAE